MPQVDRRSALGWAMALSGTVWGVPAAAEDCLAAAYPETAGEEVAPGVREVFLARQDVTLAAVKVLWLTDLVFRRGASTPADLVANDMVVLLQRGLLRVQLDKLEFVLT